jgi:ribosomal protein S18 acetylase RimI-like enzyme
MYELDLLCFTQPFTFDLRSMRRFATQKNAIVVVAEHSGNLAGFVILNLESMLGAKLAYVTTLDVHPNLRRHGLATKLMDEEERLAELAGAALAALHVYSDNEAAITFYERRGYLRGSPDVDFYGPGMNAWTYTKPLKHPSEENQG